MVDKLDENYYRLGVLPLRRISIEALLWPSRELVIVRNGREYRLRLTRNGKLILTAQTDAEPRASMRRRRRTRHARTGCPCIAVCVSRHMQALALHLDAAPVLRDICAGLHGVWTRAGEDRQQLH